MKRFLFGALWLAALAAGCAALGARFLPPGEAIKPAGLGAATGLVVFLTLSAFGWLAGMRRPPGPVPWGWPQAVWLVVQFVNMQAAAQIIFGVLVTAARILSWRWFHLVLPLSTSATIVAATALGYLAAAGWSFWYISRLGPARLRDGDPSGIAWRPAPALAYLAVLAGLLAVGLVAALVQHIWPPSAQQIAANPLRQIFGAHGWKVAALFILAAGVAPFVEEFVFRGAVFSALAGNFGTLAAALLTGAVFTGAHAYEVADYLPGLLLIGAVALVLAWLRVRYRSIRPGIALHVLFNGISVLAAAFGQ